MAEKDWSIFRAQYRPVIPRIRLYRRLHLDTWKNRKLHGGTLFVLWHNFRLATWLRPSEAMMCPIGKYKATITRHTRVHERQEDSELAALKRENSDGN